jgi:hypothetical protein
LGKGQVPSTIESFLVESVIGAEFAQGSEISGWLYKIKTDSV